MDRQTSSPIRNRFFPNLESLENRCCPSVSVVRVFNTLIVQGDGADNTVTITDQGNGAISASITGSSGNAANSGANIRNVVVYTRGGNDTVNYQLTAAKTASLNLAIDLGSYQDGTGNTNNVNLDFDQNISCPWLTIGVTGTRGQDHVFAEFGAITNTYLNYAAYLGANNDSFEAVLGGNINGYASVAMAAIGGWGNDTINVHQSAANVDIAYHALLSLLLEGNGDADTIDFDYQGQVKGKLSVGIYGGYGADTVNAELTLNSGSTGRVAAAVFGGEDSDTLTLKICGTSSSLYALLDGGAGTDTCFHTANVWSKRCENDNLVVC